MRDAAFSIVGIRRAKKDVDVQDKIEAPIEISLLSLI